MLNWHIPELYLKTNRNLAKILGIGTKYRFKATFKRKQNSKLNLVEI